MKKRSSLALSGWCIICEYGKQRAHSKVLPLGKILVFTKSENTKHLWGVFFS